MVVRTLVVCAEGSRVEPLSYAFSRFHRPIYVDIAEEICQSIVKVPSLAIFGE